MFCDIKGCCLSLHSLHMTSSENSSTATLNVMCAQTDRQKYTRVHTHTHSRQRFYGKCCTQFCECNNFTLELSTNMHRQNSLGTPLTIALLKYFCILSQIVVRQLRSPTACFLITPYNDCTFSEDGVNLGEIASLIVFLCRLKLNDSASVAHLDLKKRIQGSRLPYN